MDEVSDWMECEIERHLLHLFPAAHVFRNLDYPDPDPPNSTGELDLEVFRGPLLGADRSQCPPVSACR